MRPEVNFLSVEDFEGLPALPRWWFPNDVGRGTVVQSSRRSDGSRFGGTRQLFGFSPLGFSEAGQWCYHRCQSEVPLDDPPPVALATLVKRV